MFRHIFLITWIVCAPQNDSSTTLTCDQTCAQYSSIRTSGKGACEEYLMKFKYDVHLYEIYFMPDTEKVSILEWQYCNPDHLEDFNHRH